MCVITGESSTYTSNDDVYLPNYFNNFSNVIYTYDWIETESEFVVDVRGFSKDELNVVFENNVLTINSKEKEICGEKYRVVFLRNIFSQEKIKEINVLVKNGLAHVILIKENEQRPKINIK